MVRIRLRRWGIQYISEGPHKGRSTTMCACARACEALPLQIWWDTCVQITACSDDRGSSSVRRGKQRVGLPKKAVTWGRGGEKHAPWSDPHLWRRIAALFPPNCPLASPFLISTLFLFLSGSAPIMISKVKNAMTNLVGGMMPHGHHHHHHNHHGQGCEQDSLPPRFPYGRPDFLDLTPELLQYSTEHASRPVLVLKRGSRLPWRTGYAEWVQMFSLNSWCRLGDFL